MKIIESTYTTAITLMEAVGQTQYALLASGLAGTASLLMQLLAVLTLLSAASGRTSLGWMDAIKLIVVFTLVAAFLKNWSQFNSIFLALNSFFDGITTSMLQGVIGGGEQANTFAGSLDNMLDSAGKATTGAVGRLDVGGAILAGVMFVLMFIFAGLAIVALIGSKAALLIAVALAPAAIVCVLSEKTKSYFDQWFSALIKLLMFPVILAAIFSIIINMIAMSLLNVKGDDVINYGAFIGVGTGLVTGLILMRLSPVIVQELTGSLGLSGLTSGISKSLGGAGKAAAKVMWSGREPSPPRQTTPAGGIKGMAQDVKSAFGGEGGIGGALRGGADIRVGQLNRMAARVARFSKK